MYLYSSPLIWRWAFVITFRPTSVTLSVNNMLCQHLHRNYWGYSSETSYINYLWHLALPEINNNFKKKQQRKNFEFLNYFTFLNNEWIYKNRLPSERSLRLIAPDVYENEQMAIPIDSNECSNLLRNYKCSEMSHMQPSCCLVDFRVDQTDKMVFSWSFWILNTRAYLTNE